MSTEPNNGYLEIVVGPMFSGKTSKLLEIYKQCTFCDIPVAVINHSADTRYHDTMLSSHDKVMIPCIQTSALDIVWNNADKEENKVLRSCDVILINEAQFFSDLVPCVVSMLKENKKIYIAGLDGDFKQTKFGTILDLIPLCDKITKLTSLCSICKNRTPGIFSKRLTTEQEQTLIGANIYMPVCRAHI